MRVSVIPAKKSNSPSYNAPRLLTCFLGLMLELAPMFPQRRTWNRAMRLMLSSLLSVGRRWITRWISTAGRDQRDWTTDFRVFSRSPWREEDLFDPVIRRTLSMCDSKFIPVAFDETTLPRAGRRVKESQWRRDPCSPKFRHNLQRAVGYIHVCAIPRSSTMRKRPIHGYGVRFALRKVARKPRNTKKKKVSDEEWKAYREEKKQKNLSAQAAMVSQDLRASYDKAGARDKILLEVLDGGFCNGRFINNRPERTEVLIRMRKNAKLCKPAPKRKGKQGIYAKTKFTPEKIAKNDKLPWKRTTAFFGGRRRVLRYKEMSDLLWQGGTKRTRLRLIVIAPTPYKVTKRGKMQYRDIGYLITTALDAPVDLLIQSYLDRWQIEVNHRDLKDTIGLGDAQVWADKSVARQPAFVVAAHSMLLLAADEAYGPTRTADYEPLPKWRKKPIRPARPSIQDLVTKLRREAEAHPEELNRVEIELEFNSMLRKAAG